MVGTSSRLVGLWPALLTSGLILLGSLVWTTAAPASAACTCQDQTTQQHADDADAVFSGSVRETRRPDDAGGGGGGGAGGNAGGSGGGGAGGGGAGGGSGGGQPRPEVTYVVDVERVWKEAGTVVTDTVRVSSPRATSACGLGDLPNGTEYVFFAKARDTGFRAAACGGSQATTEAFEAEVEALLGAGRDVVPDSETPVVELTPVDTSPPTSVTRVAAPGAALALVGLLGLVLLRLAGSRRA